MAIHEYEFDKMLCEMRTAFNGEFRGTHKLDLLSGDDDVYAVNDISFRTETFPCRLYVDANVIGAGHGRVFGRDYEWVTDTLPNGKKLRYTTYTIKNLFSVRFDDYNTVPRFSGIERVMNWLCDWFEEHAVLEFIEAEDGGTLKWTDGGFVKWKDRY